jgi:uncharacterized protein
MDTITISKQTHRRFLLGLQGLWPGRRFAGVDGAAAAIRQMEALQLDPLNIAARSQEIALYGRVLDFRPDHLYQVVYEQRQFFDFGGSLFLYPMEEFPHFRAIMPRVERHARVVETRKNHAQAMTDVLAALRINGPMSNRDFEGKGISQWSYRGRKDSALALYYLWRLGEVMITNRKGFDRIYDLTERVLPKMFNRTSPIHEAEDFFARKTVAMLNLMREKRFRFNWQGDIERDVPPQEGQKKLDELYEQNILVPLHIEGSAERWITFAASLPLLADLEAGRVPSAWTPPGSTTQDEVTFVAPLEMISARGRAKQVFDFDYVWEVYKPVEQRRWGYYTLPILYGDDLVARLDPKLDRKTMTLHILGFWLEDDAPRDAAFADALTNGLNRFAGMVGAKKVDVSALKPLKLRSYLKANLKLQG